MHTRNKPFEEVTELWNTMDIKYLSRINPEVLSEITAPDEEINYIDIGSVSSDGTIYNISNFLFRDAPSRARRVVRTGDTIVSTVRTYLKAITKIDKENDGKICSTGFAVIRPNVDKVMPDFVSYVCHSTPFVDEVMSNSVGTSYPAINASQLGNIEIPLPSLEEQKIIVTYLDYKVAKIDALVMDKEKIIELLKEKRQSLISEAVTKGIDYSVPMKDSGIEWMGRIPAHWEIKRIKYVFEIIKRIYDQEDRDVLSVTQKGIKVRDTESNEGQLAETYSGYQLVNINDFVMNSMDLLTGFVDCAPYEGVTSPDYRVFRFIPRLEQSYFFYKHLFQMLYTNKIFYGFGQGVSTLGRWRLQTNTFKNFWIPVPPKEEQKQIAEYIVKQSKKIDETMEIAHKQICLLKEYRQSTINEAVMGKVKVTEMGVE